MARRLLKIFVLMILMLTTGCGQSGDDTSKAPAEQIREFQPLTAEGFYGDLRMQPNGVFLVRDKMSEEFSKGAGVVYKVEVNEEHKINKITAKTRRLLSKR